MSRPPPTAARTATPGPRPNSPLPNPVNLFREYAVGAGQTVHIGAGVFPLITPLTLSGSTDLGFGLEQGFTVIGDAGGGTILTPAIPGASPRALIDLVGANFVSLNDLTLQGAASGLIVEDGSDDFSATDLTSTGASGAGFVHHDQCAERFADRAHRDRRRRRRTAIRWINQGDRQLHGDRRS